MYRKATSFRAYTSTTPGEVPPQTKLEYDWFYYNLADKKIWAVQLNETTRLLECVLISHFPISSVYHVFATQAGAAAPVLTVLEDTITGVVAARSGAGTFTFTKAGAFIEGKTTPYALVQMIDGSDNKITAERTSDDVITVKTYAAVDTTVLADGVLNNTEFQINIFI